MRVPARRSFNGHLVLPNSVDARMTTVLRAVGLTKKHRKDTGQRFYAFAAQKYGRPSCRPFRSPVRFRFRSGRSEGT